MRGGPRFKLVPEPPADASFVADARDAVPLVPGTEDDCCARLLGRLGFRSRDQAREWLTFLRALGLATETDEGFKRLRADADPEALRPALLAGVFGARELADALLAAGEDGLTVEAAFDRLVDRVPEWERYRSEDWAETWRERVANLLGWFALLGLAEERPAADADDSADTGLEPTESDGPVYVATEALAEHRAGEEADDGG